MSDRNSMDDWQLEESPGTGDQWQLLDQEQNLPSDLQLQETGATPDRWQPVAYDESGSGSRTGWILPSLIIVALLAVLGYIGWLAMNGFEINVPASPPPATEGVAGNDGEPGVVAVTAPTEEAPTPTPLPPTATPLPEPTATATPATAVQRIVRVISPYGLNARQAPGGDGEVLAVLDPELEAVVVDEEGEWVQVELESGERYWISNSAELVEFGTRTIVLEEGAAPPPGVAAAPAEEDSAEEGSGEDAPAPAPAEGVIVRVEGAAGVNARSEPSVDGEVLAIVPQGTELVATALSEDGEWVQVTLEDGQSAWLAAEVVTVEGDPATLTEPAAEATEPAVTETEPVTGTASVTDTATVTDTVTETPADVTPLVTIDNLIGAIARAEPSTGAEQAGFAPGGAELPALGRSADGDWVQVELEDGTEAWIFIGSIALNVDLATLPVVEP